jgi:putative membrane protein insertion efficiency factor
VTVLSFLSSLPQRLLMALVRAYRLLLSPSLGSSCRFEPSCSAYALQALQQHGAAGGSYLTLRRLVRCQPWCEGGHDPVPPRLFSHLVTPVAASSEKKSSS